MEQVNFPFRLTDTLFRKLVFSRRPQMPEDVQIKLKVNVQLHAQNLPERLQIDIRVETVEEEPLAFAVELVALFEPADDGTKVDSQLAKDFVNERAFYMLFPLVRQKISEVTHVMGIKPVQLPMPVSVHIPLEEDDLEEEGTAVL